MSYSRGKADLWNSIYENKQEQKEMSHSHENEPNKMMSHCKAQDMIYICLQSVAALWSGR